MVTIVAGLGMELESRNPFRADAPDERRMPPIVVLLIAPARGRPRVLRAWRALHRRVELLKATDSVAESAATRHKPRDRVLARSITCWSARRRARLEQNQPQVGHTHLIALRKRAVKSRLSEHGWGEVLTGDCDRPLASAAGRRP